MSQTEQPIIRPMEPGDLRQVAELHRAVFGDHFLGHMTRGFLERFYRQFLEQPEAYTTVAQADGRVVGFVVGTARPDDLFRRFYRRHFCAVALSVTCRALVDPFVRRHLRQRLQHAWFAVRSFLGRAAPRGPGAPSQTPTRLLSICLAPEHRGSGVAARMVEHFCGQLRAGGICRVGLSVHATNHRAIAFYEKTGWQRERTEPESVYFFRPTED
jgi:ribosomal protein S18 acetylase RimI-like enzyme